jgi:adenylate kinase family enzyme
MSESSHAPSRKPLVSVPMERIAIVGCGGSGKSHLARVLGARLGITPIHLDAAYYDKGWKPLDQEAFAALQRHLVAAPRWIIDGNYASTLPIRLKAADTVIFLDLPGWACLWGIAQRRLRHGGGQHQAIGVYDRITWGFIRYILGYRKKMAPRVRALIASHAEHAQVTVLRSRAAVHSYLADPDTAPRPPAQGAVSHEDRG